MIYTPLTKKAMRLSFEKHKTQVDKDNIPYPFHPFHVAECMTNEYATCVALLHDIVEDTDVTLEDLKKEGFPKEVLEAVSLMTHDLSVPYFDYVKKIKENPIAREVKIADLTHNSDRSRLQNITPFDEQRYEKYKKALEILKDETKDENGFKEISIHNLNTNAVDLFMKDWGLVTAGDEKSYNTMTISWGHLGSIWGHRGGQATSIVYVKPIRYTHKFISSKNLYTICFFPESYRKDLDYLGSHSGKDEDKVKKNFFNSYLC